MLNKKDVGGTDENGGYFWHLLAIRVREREREGERGLMPKMVKIEGQQKPDRKKEFARGGLTLPHKRSPS